MGESCRIEGEQMMLECSLIRGALLGPGKKRTFPVLGKNTTYTGLHTPKTDDMILYDTLFLHQTNQEIAHWVITYRGKQGARDVQLR